jgi:hypothetical protein
MRIATGGMCSNESGIDKRSRFIAVWDTSTSQWLMAYG